jgi:hypothetical protein
MARKKISTNPLIRSTRAQELKNRLEWVFDENKIKREQIKKEWAASLMRMASKAPAVNERQHY